MPFERGWATAKDSSAVAVCHTSFQPLSAKAQRSIKGLETVELLLDNQQFFPVALS